MWLFKKQNDFESIFLNFAVSLRVGLNLDEPYAIERRNGRSVGTQMYVVIE